MWTKLGDRQPSTPVKFALGTMSIGVSFLLFIPMAGGGKNSAPLLGLVGVLLFFTISELLLSPVGLSVSTKLAPAKFHTQMVALFFLSIALGTAMSGLLSGYYSAKAEVPYFLWLGTAAIVVGAVLLAIAKPIKALMGGVR
jgi:POT family proton-dependent oligopeptide transporter